MQAFVIINSVRMMINASVNVKNWLIKVYVIEDIFGILVIVNVNVIKSCDVGEYLDYKCLKKLANKLVEECTEIVEVKIASKNEHKGSFCILYIVLFSIFVAINIGIATYFIYYYWYLKKMFQVLNLILILKQ